ncbi:uncharacterized protein LOC120205069 [Hibiscus syriacus]|uniref:uncharacterized protein LOC120205069 n=1 Tax=Hibiscus syriacus TaxID=106335 RepID=UPI0019235158|nr:uncharacterized protein LOC120205069 [Hibiscus syriacus]
MEMEKKREIKHRFHEHPLVFVEDQSNEGEKAYCSACGDVISDPCFSCPPCNYHLHHNCALAPERISSHPLHPQHSGFFLRKRPHPGIQVYGCALCKEKRNMFFYECNVCYFSLDIKCADLSSSCSKVNQESKHDFHPHPLTFIPSPLNEHKNLYCSCCHEPLVGALYICVDCPLIFHKTCIDESNKFKHPSHRIHPLFLDRNKNSLFCKLCQKQHYGFFYCCSVCDFKINILCAWSMPFVEDKSRHQHPFTLHWRRGSFICDACGTQGNYMSYTCSTCNITVHKDCTKLPRIIKFSRHDHCLFHKYFIETQELTTKDCKICFNEVNLECGSYSCVKSGCNYIVHVNCALEDDRFYEVVERESQCEELYGSSAKSTQSSITRVVEVSEDGEATKIEHFSHEGHCLVLADKMEEETDRRCDGCMLPVSTLFYYCSESECHFYLHKNCSELPRVKRHWFRRSTANLDSRSFMRCYLCRRYCSGFFYEMGGPDVCLRCAEVRDVIEFQGHEHLLFYDLKCRERCNGCGADPGPYGAFKCGKCSFALDFKCLSLPQSAVHKIDQHQLNLTYHDDNDYSKHLHCDICEVKRDPSLWYYCCSICDTSAHPDCILGEFPFLKDGITFSQYHYGHRHDVQFHRKAEDYPNCRLCGQRCRREILKCTESTCNYIAHFKCWWL